MTNTQKILRDNDAIVKSLVEWRNTVSEEVAGTPGMSDSLLLVLNQILYRSTRKVLVEVYT